MQPKVGLVISYGVGSSPFGWCVLGITKQKICYLSFLDTNNKHQASLALKKYWPTATVVYQPVLTKKYLKKIFNPKTKHFKQSFPVVLQGTPFQMRVWRALQTIPRGKTSTYLKIAQQIGSPQAVRAVGSACGKNPISFLIPCHRVLTSQGKLGGYHWGTKRKQAMLAWETTQGS